MKRENRKIWTAALLSALLLTACQEQPETETPQNTETGAQETVSEEGTDPAQETDTAEETVSMEETVSQGNADLPPAGGDITLSSSESVTVGDYTYHTDTSQASWSAGDGAEAKEILLLNTEYPVFEGDSPAEQAVNAFYREWAEGKMAFYMEDEYSGMKYVLELSPEEYSAGMPYEASDMLKEVTVTEELIAVSHEAYAYTGGAHGMPGRESHLFRRLDGSEAALTDVITLSGEELDEKVRGLFLEKVNTAPEQFFQDAAETLKEKTNFEKNAWFTPDGVVFFTTPYEIAPYAAGFPEVTIPYEELGIRR